MKHVKIIAAETAAELEAKLNHWVYKVKPLALEFHFSTDSLEYPYLSFIIYKLE